MAYRLFFDQVEDPSTQFLDLCPESAFFWGVRYPIDTAKKAEKAKKAKKAKILKSLFLELGSYFFAFRAIFGQD